MLPAGVSVESSVSSVPASSSIRAGTVFALQSGRLLQSQADPQDVVIARREPFAGIFVGVAGFVERRATPSSEEANAAACS